VGSSAVTVGDFDVSSDHGATFVNGTSTTVEGAAAGATVRFGVTLGAAPTHVRYTGNQGFPQCAVYNREGYPAFPFVLQIEAAL
jgi:hypothetical protein